MADLAVILAGGRGTRLMPLTKDTPKPMVMVGGRPYLRWQLDHLKHEGFSNVLILAGYLGEVMRAHFEREPVPGMKIETVIEQEPLGSGGALKFVESKLPDTFLLINGDSFCPMTLNDFAKTFHSDKPAAQIATLTDFKSVPVPANIKHSGKKITAYKKGAGMDGGFTGVDAGVYMLRRDALRRTPQSQKFDLEVLWPALIEEGNLNAFPIKTPFFDIGTVERLKIFERHLHDYFPNTV